MNTRTSYVVIAIMAVVGGLSIAPAFGQQLPTLERIQIDDREWANQATMDRTPITVWTDRTIYDHDSTVTVEGFIPNYRPGAEIGITVIGPPPFQNLVLVDQIQVNNDGTFKTTFSTAGPGWKYDGTYTIRATFGTQEVFDTALVQLTGGTIGFETTECGENAFPVAGFCIPYTISSATLTGATISPHTSSMTIMIITSGDGSITMEIPRNVLDTDSTRDPLFVLVNGEEVDAEEVATGTSRTVTIEFLDGAEEIEIIGTFAIPEFGTIAALILAVAIVSIIAVTARSRLNVLPKY